MPPLSATTNKPVAAERKIKRAKRKRAYTRPPIAAQPGPFTNTERRKVKRNTKTKAYQKSLQKARVHGPKTRRGTGPGEDKSVTPAQQKAIDRGAKQARIRYVRAHRTTGKKLITRELEGKGVLAKILSKTASEAGPKIAKVQSRNLRPIRTQSSAQVSEKVLTNAARDFITFPSQAVPSVYVPIAAGVEAAKGDTRRAKQLGKDIKANDPVYNAVAAGVEAARGNSEKAKEHLKAARDAATEHPGLTALEVAGVKGGVGRATSRTLRGGGRTVRRAGKVTGSKTVERAGEKIRKAGSTERNPKRVAGTNIVEDRSYSRDTFTKARQVTKDRAARRKVKRLNKQATRAHAKGHEDNARDLREQAVRADPDRVSAREIKRQVDEDVQVREDIRRLHRTQATRPARKIVKSAKREKGALSVVAQRIARADREDLADYVRELEAEAKTLTRSKLRANRQLRKQLQAVIDDPKADMTRLEASAKAYQAHTGPTQAKLGELQVLDPKQVERAAVIPYAVRRMSATHDDKAGLLDNKGRPLSTKRVLAHMSRNGESPAAFLTQAPGMRGARNFNVRAERAPQAGPTGRTGEATRKGTFDADPETLVEGAARGQGLVDAAEGFHASLKHFGLRTKSKNGKTELVTRNTKREIDQVARNLLHHDNGDPNPEAVPMRPVRLNPLGGRKATLEKLLEDVDKLSADEHNQILDSLKDAVSGKDGEGPWALIPDAAAQRILDHLNTQGGGGGLKTVQLLNQTFRKTVLSTSTSWLAGNVIEGALRATLAHAGPRSFVTGLKVKGRLREIDPAMADELMSRALGGGHMTSVDRAGMRRGAEQFEGTALAPVANALGKFWRTPGPKQAAELWNHYTHFVMRSLSGRVETGIQTAMLGRALRKSPLMDQRVLKMTKAAYDDAARGLTNTAAQIRFGREVDVMYGKYSKLSPSMKRMVSTYTPFISWWTNSVYFVYRTLPRDHPVVTGLIASAEQATEEWRKNHGLDQFMDGAVPGFLQGSIPVSGDRKQRAPTRYTPFGAFSDPGGTVAGQVTPLASGVLAGLQGRDWTGKELRVKGTDGKTRPANPLEKLVFASHSFLQSTVPFLSTGERIKVQGAGALNPFKTTAPKKTKTRKIRRPSSSGGFFGSSSSSGKSGGGSFFGD